MEIDQPQKLYVQPALFDVGDSTSGSLELLPRLWFAVEKLSSPDPDVRREGVSEIAEFHAARLSPLVAYLVFTRISDPDLEIRKSVVKTLSGILGPDQNGLPAPDEVRINLYTHLSQMDVSYILDLLELAAYSPESESEIKILLKACTHAGDHLADILGDRNQDLKTRELAAVYIGRIGYLDAQPALERIARRLEAKVSGQQSMSFSRVNGRGEIDLLPALRQALEFLRAP